MRDREHSPVGSRGNLPLMPVENPAGPEQRAELFGLLRKAVEKTSTSLLSAAPETLLRTF